MNRPILIGIAGGTGSGKTTLSQKLFDAFKDDVLIMCHDSYYKSQNGIPFEERLNTNYDHPDAFETNLLTEHLSRLLKGKSINRPLYSFIEHTRLKETESVKPTKVIILEGILILADKKLRDIMDMKIYVDTDADLRFIRRLLRDVKERGRDIDSVVAQYVSTVKPMHEMFVEPSKKYADIIIPEGGHNTVALSMLIDKINAVISGS